jgi:LuxR family maltose regulon positive regulatory protein
LREEIFNELPDEEQDFLLKTSILERLCGPLCDAVCEEENGQVRLEALERENLFLIPLDDRREWYRYHSLFHEFLHSELQRRRPEESARLHRQAAGWHLEHGMPEAAFRHALEGRDPERISQILERYLMAKLMSGEIRMVKGWLEALPEAWRNQQPIFLLAQAGILLVTGQYEACSRCLDEVERLAVKKLGPGTEAPKKSAQARAISMRCNIACFQNDLARAEALAAEALKIMPAGELDFQAGVYGSLGDTYRRNGRWEEARESYRKLLDFTQAEGFRVQAVHVYGALADLELRQGHLRGADAYWEKALGAIRKRENWGNYPLPLTGWVFIRLAELAYERNRLVEAREFVAQGLERAELGGDVRAIIAGCVAAGRLELAEGEAEGADGYLERARPYTETAQFPYWNRRFERLQVELWLAGNRLRAAADWVDAKLSEAALAGPEREAEELAIARVLIVKGDEESNRRALRRLERLLQAAEAEGRGGIVIETLALQALAHAKEGELARALRALERALRLAEPEGYLRLFADFGLPMGQLLQEARSRGVLPEYTNTLLAAFDSSRFSPVGAGLRLPDPLTKREEQILELLAAGLTNPEIAGQLFISTETVKKHASNIYGKLGVSTRTEAAARARELHLLD